MNTKYFGWLKSIVLPAPNNKPYNKLLNSLYFETFDPISDYQDYDIAEYDDNRASDGKYLRYIYSGEEDWDNGYSSILEMLIALANRFDGCVGFNPMDTTDVRKNFWIMIRNLGLWTYDDTHFIEEQVDEILWIFKTRNYRTDGSGGLFPLKNPKKDQRKIEIWAQLQEYLVENDIE